MAIAETSARIPKLTGTHLPAASNLRRAIAEAVGWIGVNLPVYALNLILTTPIHLRALPYPPTPAVPASAPLPVTAGGRNLDPARTPHRPRWQGWSQPGDAGQPADQRGDGHRQPAAHGHPDRAANRVRPTHDSGQRTGAGQRQQCHTADDRDPR